LAGWNRWFSPGSTFTVAGTPARFSAASMGGMFCAGVT
jgi:hypothetical protein